VFDFQPEITSGGTVVATYEADSAQWECIYTCGWVTANTYVGLDRPPRGGSDFFSAQPGDIPSACDGGDLNNVPQYPSPSPDGTRIVYTNCTVGNTPNTTVVSNMDGTNQQACGADDQPITDPSFSLDGSRIVEAEGGNDPGLWDYPSACPPASNAYVHALVPPSGTSFQSPRYVAGGRIFFVAIASGQKGGDVWSIPDSCGQNGTPCRFPADATQITHTNGDVLNVGWTSQSLVSSASSNPGGTTTTTNGGGGGGTTRSAPKARCTVPNLHGKTLKAAKKALKKAHCRAGKTSRKRSKKIRKGRVISSKPKAGKKLPNNAKVKLTLSKGR
jgi:hypothetical protein